MLLIAGPAAAQTEQSPRTLFGISGMIDMPSARMAPDGEVSLTASFFENNQRYGLGFQVLPWLEASFQYAGLSHFSDAFPVYYDRSFAFKARLFQESAYLPAIAIGVNDIVGTGVYGGEYLVASKQIGDIDATLGIGWGRLGSSGLFRNPFTLISKSFEPRSDFNAVAGTGNFNTLFHGATSGLFGGLAWHTPLTGVTAIAEYSSDIYNAEAISGNFKPRSQVNFGIDYAAFDGINVGLNWLYGRTIAGRVSFQIDPRFDAATQRLGPVPTPVHIRTQEEQHAALETLLTNAGRSSGTFRAAGNAGLVDAIWNSYSVANVSMNGTTLVLDSDSPAASCGAVANIVARYSSGITAVSFRGAGKTQISCNVPSPRQNSADQKAVTRTITSHAAAEQIGVPTVIVRPGEITVYYVNLRYFAETDAVERLTRILMADAPPDVEKFHMIAMEGGVSVREFDITRGSQERAFDQEGAFDLLGPAVTVENPALQVEKSFKSAMRSSYPQFSWYVSPQVRMEYFDPSNPLAFQAVLGATGAVELFSGFSLSGEAEASLLDNFNIGRQSDSLLPHVRSDFLNYFSKGKTGIGELGAHYQFRLTPDIYGRLSAGLLESMYGGAGGEFLWQPSGVRWAFGVDAYEVWQRGYERLFTFLPYHTFTGHATLYYQSPWYNLDFAVSAGRYLAKDYGMTLEVTRRFASGVEIGAFMTKTNVSAHDFGEGSFDKGLVIRIPLNFALPINTQSELRMLLRPVQRDGGQRLSGDAELYDGLRRSSDAELQRHAGNINSQAFDYDPGY